MPGLSKKNKIYQNGIEITEIIDFKNWEPGYEYTKNISLKNLNSKTIRLAYEWVLFCNFIFCLSLTWQILFIIKRIPNTRYFATIYPKIITLSPGTTFNLPITFKPLEKVLYEDFVDFTFHESQIKFQIPLKGQLPNFNLDFIESIDFGICAAFECINKEVQITNLR